MPSRSLCRAKNTTGLLAKNFMVFAISMISFWVLGWGLMFGRGNGFATHPSSLSGVAPAAATAAAAALAKRSR